MLQGGYKIRDQSAIHFISFAVVEWVDVFTRKMYSDIVIDSLEYCQNNKGLWLHAWCIMSNHLHLAASAENQNLSDVLRDFKTHTSKKIVPLLKRTPTKAGGIGCCVSFAGRVSRIAGIESTSSGGRITVQRSCMVPTLSLRKLITFIKTLL